MKSFEDSKTRFINERKLTTERLENHKKKMQEHQTSWAAAGIANVQAWKDQVEVKADQVHEYAQEIIIKVTMIREDSGLSQRSDLRLPLPRVVFKTGF